MDEPVLVASKVARARAGRIAQEVANKITDGLAPAALGALLDQYTWDQKVEAVEAYYEDRKASEVVLDLLRLGVSIGETVLMTCVWHQVLREYDRDIGIRTLANLTK